MAKKKTSVIKVFDSNVVAEEEYYLNNPNLPTVNSGYEYTPEMVKAIKRCKEDIIYFAENFFYINGINGKEIIKLFDKQKEILKTIQKNKKNLLITSRQFGKCCFPTTMISLRYKPLKLKIKLPIIIYFWLIKITNFCKKIIKK